MGATMSAILSFVLDRIASLLNSRMVQTDGTKGIKNSVNYSGTEQQAPRLRPYIER